MYFRSPPQSHSPTACWGGIGRFANALLLVFLFSRDEMRRVVTVPQIDLLPSFYPCACISYDRSMYYFELRHSRYFSVSHPQQQIRLQGAPQSRNRSAPTLAKQEQSVPTSPPTCFGTVCLC